MAVGGGIIFGVVVLLLICRARNRRNQDKKLERPVSVSRVSFKIPPPKMDAHVIPTQTRYPQKEHYELEQYLDPEIYRYCN